MRMSWGIFLMGLVSIIAGIILKPKLALAALPPVSSEDLENSSLYIVVGEVKSVSSQEVEVDWGTNYQFTVTVKVERVEKGLLNIENGKDDDSVDSFVPPGVPTPGSEIEVRYWAAGQRPDGWTGPQGQSSNLMTGMTVRLFLEENEEGFLSLLEPNGWQLVD